MNTIMAMAFIEAQQKANQEQQMEIPQVVDTRSIANKVFDLLRDEGVPMDVSAVAKALEIDRQQASTALFQLKKSGYVNAIAKPGSYMTYEAKPDVEYGMARTHRLNKPTRNMSQVVTTVVREKADAPKIMQALPAPNGLKLTIQTDDGPVVMSVGMAREVHKQLSALFSGVGVSFDD